MNLADLRESYTKGARLEDELVPDALEQFRNWLQEAMNARIAEPNAMTLATSDAEGHLAARIVLLKGVDERGFIFFTNYHSRKGAHLLQNHQAALNFWWPEVERQVCVEGVVTQVSAEESDAYFQSRPFGSRIGAWVSEQSAIIPDRTVLDHRLTEYEVKFADRNVPRPSHWGGYVLHPTRIEFWQGRPNRLHDRFLYTQSEKGWHIERLSP